MANLVLVARHLSYKIVTLDVAIRLRNIDRTPVSVRMNVVVHVAYNPQHHMECTIHHVSDV